MICSARIFPISYLIGNIAPDQLPLVTTRSRATAVGPPFVGSISQATVASQSLRSLRPGPFGPPVPLAGHWPTKCACFFAHMMLCPKTTSTSQNIMEVLLLTGNKTTSNESKSIQRATSKQQGATHYTRATQQANKQTTNNKHQQRKRPSSVDL